MSSLKRIKLFLGNENECGYLADKKAKNIYADPHHPNPGDVYNQLITRGFRRSGEFVYRPGCDRCKACVPVRILAGGARLRRTDKRNLKTNSDILVRYCKAQYTDEYFELYQRYLSARHAGDGMDNPSPEDFERFLLNPWGDTLFIEMRIEDTCVAVAVTDVAGGGLSAVYTFFDPSLEQRGLGRFSILQQIQLCKDMDLPYLYLGYWVEGCQKMEYKSDFRPQQQYDGDQWITVE